MGMKLESLAQLHRNMKEQGITKTKFDFKFRNLQFSVIYIAEKFPHELLFGCRAHNLFFVIQIPDDFIILTYLSDSVFAALIKLLDLDPDPNNRFSPNVFFDELKGAIPKTASAASIASISDIASIRRDVEDADKIYFCGWLTHDGISSKPTPKNLAKTTKICGHATYEFCLRNSVSSRWTDIENNAIEYYEPHV